MLTSILHPYKIFRAFSGQQALDIMGQTVPDIAFIDLMMPVLDGHQLIAKMRADTRLRHVPVVIVSAQDMAQDQTQLQSPLRMRFKKPIGVAQGAKCLRALMDAVSSDYLPHPGHP